MAVRLIVPLKYDKERVTYWIDLSSELLIGETLGSVSSVSAVSILGNDTSPNATLDGTQIVRTSAGVSIKDGMIGEMYQATVVVSTSLGREIAGLVEYAVSFAPVVETFPLPFPPTDPVYRETVLTTAIGQEKTLFLGRTFALTTTQNPEVNAVLDWGDGSPTVPVLQASNFSVQSHVYAAPGTYQIKITGVCSGINSSGQGVVKTLSVDNFGLVGLKQARYNSQDLLTYVPSFLPVTMEVLTGMFQNCTIFNSGAVSFWDVSRINNFGTVFDQASSFNRPLAGWDVHSGLPTTYNNMFNGCVVFNQNLNNWDVSSMTEGRQMFKDCRVLNQPFSNWNVAANLNFTDMFSGCWAFNQPLNTWNVGAGTSFAGMFYQCIVFNQNLNNWNVGNGVNFGSMFNMAVRFNGNIDNWDVSKGIAFGRMFCAAAITYDETYGPMDFNRNISSWNVGNGTGFDRMFLGCRFFNQPITGWNVAKSINFEAMFMRAVAFNQDISAWNVGLVRFFDAMFSGFTSQVDPGEPLLMAFAQDLSTWNVTSQAQDFGDMFAGCVFLNFSPAAWDVQNVTRMAQMFAFCWTFDGSLLTWNTAKVTNFAGMFANCHSFNQPLNHFNTAVATDMAGMLGECWNFNQPLNSWDVSKVIYMEFMFTGSFNFNGNISAWNTVLVLQMNMMFARAASFNSDISGWNTQGVMDMTRMFEEADAFNRDLSGWCVTGIPVEPEGFDLNADSWVLPRPVWGTCPP